MSGRIRLQILVDRSSIEVFGNHGKISMSTTFFPDLRDTDLGIFTRDGDIRIISLEANRLESIWPKAELM